MAFVNFLQLQALRLPSLEDRLLNVRRQKREPQQPACPAYRPTTAAPSGRKRMI
jgi:hypothetical protein